VIRFPTATEGCHFAADFLARTIVRARNERGRAVLGLATGATPIPVYARLVDLHAAHELSFESVISYNLDEYYPISPIDPNSYRCFMDRHLFSRVNMSANHAHLLDGTVPEHSVADHAAQFDAWIQKDGSLDVQLLGIGRNGHVGFNEPSELSVDTALALPTRLVDLHPITIEDAAKDFGGDANRVPRRALTLGMKPILEARGILVLAFGRHKAEAVAQSINGPMSAQLPGSLLQAAGDRVTWVLDEAAAAEI
jgi:glucosamine-6-phosphate deaminase